MSMDIEDEVAIDFYHCEVDEFKEYIEDPSLTLDTLEEYVKQMKQLIEEQKDKDDKAAQQKELSPNFSVASSTTSSRPARKSRSRRTKNTDIEPSTNISRRTRQHSRTNKIHEESDEDEVHENTPQQSRSNSTNPTSRQNSVEYEWMNGVDINDQPDDNGYSSDERLLNFDVKTLSEQDVDALLSDKPSDSKHKSSKSSKKDKKKKKSKKHKKKKDKKKKKKKSKRKSGKSAETSDADYMLSSDEEEDAELAAWNAKEFEYEIESWSLTRLQKEMKTTQQQIEEEVQRCSKRAAATKKKSKSPADDDDDDEDDDDSSDEEALKGLSMEQLRTKVANKLSQISQQQQQRQEDSEDPNRLYCICRKPYDHTNSMIMCDYCGEWYHTECIGLADDQISDIKDRAFRCPPCNNAPPLHAQNNHNNAVAPMRRQRGRRNVIADSASDTDHGGVHQQLPLRGATMVMNDNSNHQERQKQTVEKYQKVVAKLQERLRHNVESLKQKEKELLDRLSKAKHDIDAERKLRIEIQQHLERAQNESSQLMQQLADKLRLADTKELQMVAKMTKMEAKCKKHKDSASEYKKKMKSMKEEHQQRLNELEEEMIPTLNKRVKIEEEKYAKLHHEFVQQQNRLQQVESQYNYYMVENQKQLKNKLDTVSAELAKTQTEKAQMEHRLNTLHHDVTQHHQQWSDLDQTQKDQIQKLEQKISLLQQQNNALRNGTNLPPSAYNMLSNKIDHQNITLPRPPSPVKMPVAPAYLKFNDLELEELKMCRELCQKLLEAQMFPTEHMASRANVTEPLFLAWITGIGKLPTVINDLNTHNSVPPTDKNQHISMNSIRMLLIEIRRHLECIQKGEQGPHDAETLNKVKVLLAEFHAASTTYEQKMTEFKMLQHQRLMEAVQQNNSVLEYLSVTGQDAEGKPRSDWVKVVVLQYEQQQNRVLIRKESGDNSMFWASVDSAVLRLPENNGNGGSNNNVNGFGNANSNNSRNNGNHVHHNNTNNSNESNHNTQNSSPSMQLINGGQPSGVFPVPSRPVSSSNPQMLQSRQRQQQQQQPRQEVPQRQPLQTTLHLSQQPQSQQNVYTSQNNNNLMLRSRPNQNSSGLAVPVLSQPPTLNFNGIQALGNLPPFDQLQANKMANTAPSINLMGNNNNTMLNNNSANMSQTSHTRPMNGAQHQPVIIEDNSDDEASPKSSSRKRKRDDHSSSKSNKKKKRSSGKHSKEETDDEDDSNEDTESEDTGDDESEASASDVSSGSDTESESESNKKSSKKSSKRKKKKKDKKSRKRDKKRSKKKDKKHKHHKEDKASSKSHKKSHSSKKKHDTEARSESPASSRKRRGTKRGLPSSAKANGGNPNKKRKIDHTVNAQAINGHLLPNGHNTRSTSKSDFVVLNKDGVAVSSSDQEADKNDSNCRICKHPGNLVCCEGCPSAYHADCIRPRVQQKWLDLFEDWFCPSCAPRMSYIPLKDKKTGKKWPQDKEPLLQDLKLFLKRHSHLERDYSPEFHNSRKEKQNEAAHHRA